MPTPLLAGGIRPSRIDQEKVVAALSLGGKL